MELQDPQYCVQEFYSCRDLARIKKAIQCADETWMEEFIEHGGLGAILDRLDALGSGEYAADVVSDAVPRLEVVACLKAVMNCRYGLDSLIRRGGKEGSFVNKIALALDTDNMLLKIHLFLVLSAISKHSAEGLKATLDALDCYKQVTCQRHRYSVLVQELSQTAEFPEYQATVLAFVNYLLASCAGLQERMRLRSELNALDLTDILGIMRYSDSAALSQQLQLYEAGVLKDREEVAMPGGVDISDHRQIFMALFEKVFGTPNSTKLLSILQKMLLIDRDTLVSDIAWTALEKMTESALKISTEQQAQRVTTAEIDGLRRALEEEQVRKTAEERAAGKSSEAGEDALSSHDNPQPATSPTTAAPPPGPPPPGAPPPPPPMFGGMKKTVAAIRSIFDKARFYQPKKRMKKLNWEKAPEYDAKLLSALWHKASEVDVGVRVSVSEKLIETLFCQKAENTDGQLAGKSTKTHLPDQKKALNVNIVLGSMKTERPDPDNPASMKKVPLSNEEVLSVIREGNMAAITLNQVTILKEQAPNDKDVGFLNQFNSDRSGLGRVEQFMLGLLDMPAYSVRLRVLRTRKVFEELEGDYLPTFELIHTAMKELMTSSSLRDLFYIILLTGNFINGNTKLGSAYGFKISSLQRLSTTLANVKKKTTLTVNFLHYLVTVCEKDCPRLLKFRSELPHLDDASRVSVVIIQEELDEWQEEIDKLKEIMSAANDEGLPPDFIGQMQDFIPEAEATLGRLGGGLEAVRASGRQLAQYLCDSRDDFLEVVFGEIKNFSDEFDLTVKETVQEKPIWLTPDPTPPADGTPAALLSPQPNSIPPSPTDSQPRRGIRRATSIITEHVMDIPSSLMPITEEEQLSQNVERDDNPFVFPQGQIRGDGYTSTSHESSPPIYMTPTTDPEIVITDLEGDGSNEAGSNEIHREITTSETPALESTADAVEQRQSSVRRNSSLSGPRSRTKRHSIHEVNRPGFSMLSRQASWNDYKGHSPPLQRRGWTGNVQRYQSVDPHTIFGGSLDDVARLLHKMAEAIQKDSGN